MTFPTPPDPHDMLGPPHFLGPEMTTEELQRQIDFRERLEAFARELRDWWEANRERPIPEATSTVVVQGQKLELSKTTLEWFEGARKAGEKDAGDKLAAHIISNGFLKALARR